MAIFGTDITDLVNETLPHYARGALANASTKLQRYVAAERLIGPTLSGAAFPRVTLEGGTDYRFKVITKGDANTRHIGFYEVDNIDQTDGTTEGVVPWKYVETGCQYDVKELPINQGTAKLVDFLATKETQMWLNFFEVTEADFWDGPADSTDTKVPFGLLKYWLQYNADMTDGFSCGNHTNFAGGPAGLSCLTAGWGDRWKHYGGQYADVTDADLIAKMRRAIRLTEFMGIPNGHVRAYADGVGHDYGIYVTNTTLQSLENLLDAKSDGVRKDLAQFDGTTHIARVPITWVPYLHTYKATSQPVIGLDWNDIKVVGLSNEWMRDSPYAVAAKQHDVRVRFLNCSWNTVMTERRRHFLFAKSSPLTS